MEQKTLLETIDSDLMDEVLTRRSALRNFGAMGARVASVMSAPVALGLMAKAAVAQSSGLPQQIVDVLNFALTLEELEAEFYRGGLATAGLIPTAFRPVFEIISEHENAHVAFLRSVLGSQAIAKPTFVFERGPYGNVFAAFGTFADLSQLFEDTGVRAYKGQAGNLMSNDAILTAALQIHSVEARHAALVRSMRGQKPVVTNDEDRIFGSEAVYEGEEQSMQFGVDVPAVSRKAPYLVWEAFDEPLTKEQVTAIIKPFLG